MTQEDIKEIVVEHKLGLDTEWRHGKLADFSGMDLRGLHFKGMNLQEANFQKTNLKGVNFSGANLSGVDFENADLRQANLRNTNLKTACFNEADIRGAKTFGISISYDETKNTICSCLVIGYFSKKILIASILIAIGVFAPSYL